MMQDKNGSDSTYLVPGTWYLAPLHHSHISNLNGALHSSRPFRAIRAEISDPPHGRAGLR